MEWDASLDGTGFARVGEMDWMFFGFGVLCFVVIIPAMTYIRSSPRYRSDPRNRPFRALTWFWSSFAIFWLLNGLYHVVLDLGPPRWLIPTLVALAAVSVIGGIGLSVRELLRLRRKRNTTAG